MILCISLTKMKIIFGLYVSGFLPSGGQKSNNRSLSHILSTKDSVYYIYNIPLQCSKCTHHNSMDLNQFSALANQLLT